MLKKFIAKLVVGVVALGSTHLINAVVGKQEFSPEVVSDNMIDHRARTRMVESFGLYRFNRAFFEFARRFESYLAQEESQGMIFRRAIDSFNTFSSMGATFPKVGECTTLDFEGVVQANLTRVLVGARDAYLELARACIPSGAAFQQGFSQEEWAEKCRLIFIRSCQAAVVRAFVQAGWGRCVCHDPLMAIDNQRLLVSDLWTHFCTKEFPAFGEACFSMVTADKGVEETMAYLRAQPRTCIICHESLLAPDSSIYPFYTLDGSLTRFALAIKEGLSADDSTLESALVTACHVGCYLRV